MGPYQRTPKEVTRAIRYSGSGVRSVGPVGDFLELRDNEQPLSLNKALLGPHLFGGRGIFKGGASRVPPRTPISPLGSTTGRSWRPERLGWATKRDSHVHMICAYIPYIFLHKKSYIYIYNEPRLCQNSLLA